MTMQDGVQGAPAPRPRKGGKGGLIAAAVGLLVVAGVAIGAYAYWMGSRADSTARAHLPSTCEAVVRVDVTSILETKVVQDEILEPLADNTTALEKAGKVSRFVAAKVNPKSDLKELVLCVTDLGKGKPAFVGILGGSLVEDSVVEALDSHDEGKDFGKPKEVDGRLVIQHEGSGVYVTQSSEDAAILFASDEKLLAEANETSDDWKDYGLPLDEPFSAAVTEKAADQLTKQLNAIPGLSLKGAGKIDLTASLDPGRIRAEIGVGDQEAAQAFVEAVGSFMALAKLSPIGPTSSKEAKQLMRGTKLEAEDGTVEVKVDVPDAIVEGACEDVGKWLIDLEEG